MKKESLWSTLTVNSFIMAISLLVISIVDKAGITVEVFQAGIAGVLMFSVIYHLLSLYVIRRLNRYFSRFIAILLFMACLNAMGVLFGLIAGVLIEAYVLGVAICAASVIVEAIILRVHLKIVNKKLSENCDQ